MVAGESDWRVTSANSDGNSIHPCGYLATPRRPQALARRRTESDDHSNVFMSGRPGSSVTSPPREASSRDTARSFSYDVILGSRRFPSMSYVPDSKRYDSMQYRRVGRSGLRLPAISLGLWHNFGHDRPLDTQRAIIRRAFDVGVTHFDLANNYGPPYGSAEENFGRILATDLRGYRDELVVSTKAGWDMWPGPYGDLGSRKYLLASLDQSLARMGLEYVDIFYSHRFDPDTPLEETL